MLPNSGGCQNRLLFRNGLVGVFKVQMLASNIAESKIVCTSGSKSNKDFSPLSYIQITNAVKLVKIYKPKHFQSCRNVQNIKFKHGAPFF